MSVKLPDLVRIQTATTIGPGLYIDPKTGTLYVPTGEQLQQVDPRSIVAVGYAVTENELKNEATTHSEAVGISPFPFAVHLPQRRRKKLR